MLTGLARPDSGTFSIGGIDCLENPRGAQHLIGVVPDESNLYPELSGFDNLCFCGALYGMRKADREAGPGGSWIPSASPVRAAGSSAAIPRE